jgi:Flp pilus assembly protein TadD
LTTIRYQEHLAHAQSALRKGDLNGAERAIGSVLADSPRHLEALLLLAEVRRMQGRLADAETLARKAVEANPINARALGLLAALLQVQQRFEEARSAYADAMRHEPGADEIRLNFARCLLAMGAFEEAVVEAKTVAGRRPGVSVCIVLSDALRGLRRSDEAVAAAEHALLLAPNNRQAQLAKARALETTGRAKEALAAYRPLEVAGFVSTDEPVAAARAAMSAGETGEAERLLESAVRRWPQDEPLLAALTRVRWTAGRGEDFALPLLEALERAPDDMRLRLSAANILYRAGKTNASLELLHGGLARRAGDPTLLSSLAVVLDSDGRAEEALAAYDDALVVAPHDDGIRANRVAALLRVGRVDEALSELEPLRRKKPHEQRLIAREAIALRLKGDRGYRRLYNYDLYVRPYELKPPAGYASIAEFNAELRERLMRLHAAAEHPLDQSLRNGTQTTEDLARSPDPVIRAFIDVLDEPIRDYIFKLPNDPDDPMGSRKSNGYRIWGAWSVRLRSGGFHVNHVHPDGWISSSYYVDVPAPREGDDPHAGWIKFGEPDLPVPGCEPERFIEPKPGKLVLFPSYMWHGTVPFTLGERVTAPFDVVPA